MQNSNYYVQDLIFASLALVQQSILRCRLRFIIIQAYWYILDFPLMKEGIDET